jgi:hypothetical protein
MKNLKSFDQLNEALKPGYESKELLAMIKPIMNEVYEATFTAEAKRDGIEDKDEQTMAHILSKIFQWDRDSILKTCAYALEDANFHEDYDVVMKMTK